MTFSMERLNLAEKFSTFGEYWKPKILAEVNDAYVRLVKVKGEFVWHRHKNEDELFLVIKGAMHLQTREGDVSLDAGDMAVVPRGTEHRPVAEEEAHVLLIEPKSTLNTGNVRDERTTEAEWIKRSPMPVVATSAKAKGLQQEGGSPRERKWQVLSRRNFGFSRACGCSC